jgi:hypothetical protein
VVRSNPDWLESGVEMHWSFRGLSETAKHLDAAGFEVVKVNRVDDRLADDDADDGYFPFVVAQLQSE